MLQIIKKKLKQIKSLIVRKVLLEDSYWEEGNLVFVFELRNFRNIKKEIAPLLEIDETLHLLDFEYHKKQLTIHIPSSFIKAIESKAKVKLMINNKNMWIKQGEHFTSEKSYYIRDGQYLKTSIPKKNIRLSWKYQEYSFMEEPLELSSVQTEYGSVNCICHTEEAITEFLLINHEQNKLRSLAAETRNQNMRLTGFELVSQGIWQIYANIGQRLHPIKMKQEAETFVTFNHRIQLLEQNGVTCCQLVPHHLEITEIVLEKLDASVLLKFNTKHALRKGSKLIINDLKLNEDSELPLDGIEELYYTVQIPLEVLYREFSNKRFFIVNEGNEPIKYQFNVDGTVMAEERWAYPEIIEHQSVNVTFYRRKDASLGVRMPRPKIRKQITSIKDAQIRGQVGSLGRFIDCDLFLFIEERESGEALELAIENNFKLNLQDLQLFALKSKGKTVIDLFIVLKDREGQIIRKEKIKYADANYKKDQYYGYWKETDSLGMHHFLLTTTPFDNLKIETFLVGSEIVLPTETFVKDENTWLIGERYDTAQDNGFALFEWLSANTSIDAYYVIEENSQDYEKIKDKSNVLRFGTREHFDIAFKAKVLLGTHDLENLLPYKSAEGFFGYEDTLKVFLQHGVLGRKNVEYHKKYYEHPFDLFVVSSDPEKYDVVVDQFGYDEKEVIVTGLARFDKLPVHNETKDILLMPTWRDWINTDEQFLNSDYYHLYAGLVNNPKLLELLEKYNVRLNFYPHYRSQVYFNEDMLLNKERVRFIPLGIRRVQDLLIEHALLITDYSSVSFDFTMMKKPVIFYHFDVKRFFRKGILRPIDETFLGGIANTEEEVIALIEERLVKGLEDYQMDISGIIKYRDHHNCERIYNEVKQLLKDEK